MGRRLVWLLHEAGAVPSRNRWIFFGSCAGSGDLGLFEGAREAILASGRLDPSCFQDGIAALREWSKRPDAALWFALCWAEGIRPVFRSALEGEVRIRRLPLVTDMLVAPDCRGVCYHPPGLGIHIKT